MLGNALLQIQIADDYLTFLYFFMLLVCLFCIALSISSSLPSSYPNANYLYGIYQWLEILINHGDFVYLF